ncbi:MAG TPA: hypothetical protein VK487_01960 [Candidatus Bathyarchaeia archaeon]|nr:hypothetical protein [Candidatus Bathyarchaeia archaeon]
MPSGLVVSVLGHTRGRRRGHRHGFYVRQIHAKKKVETEREKDRNRILVVVENGEKSLKTHDGHVIPLKEYLERKTS